MVRQYITAEESALLIGARKPRKKREEPDDLVSSSRAHT
jgi:hypothetical protein